MEIKFIKTHNNLSLSLSEYYCCCCVSKLKRNYLHINQLKTTVQMLIIMQDVYMHKIAQCHKLTPFSLLLLPNNSVYHHNNNKHCICCCWNTRDQVNCKLVPYYFARQSNKSNTLFTTTMHTGAGFKDRARNIEKVAPLCTSLLLEYSAALSNSISTVFHIAYTPTPL